MSTKTYVTGNNLFLHKAMLVVQLFARDITQLVPHLNAGLGVSKHRQQQLYDVFPVGPSIGQSQPGQHNRHC